MSDRTFRKSSYSNLDCVEARELPDGTVEVRTSRSPHGTRLRYSGREWRAFVRAVKEGQFDFGPSTPEGA